MAKKIKPLSATQVKNLKPEAKEFSIGDGDGLFLRIMPNGTKSWLFNYIHPSTKKRKNIGLGKYPDVSLSAAREKRRDMRELVANGIDPKTHRDNQQNAEKLAAQDTLLHVAKEWFELKQHSVSSDYADDIWRSLELHIFPNLGQLPLREILAPTVIAQLRPLEAKGSLETVKRVCQRLNEVMTYAVNCGKVEANPIANIKQVFKKPKVKHMKTITPQDLPFLLESMSKVNIKHITRCAFEFQLHTLTRPAECARAEWSEIDFDNRLWVISHKKMKMKRDHKIPLSHAAIQLLEFMKPISFGQKYVFPSDKTLGEHMNSQSVNAALKRAGMSGKLVSHGMRSIGSTALNEQGFNKDAIELCLAHVDKNTIRDIYNNAEYLEERRNIMQWWSDYIISASKNTFILADKPELV
ncbi:phage integrase [Vibrio ponticus]|nr:phage integrase [Vibrio ponticus]